MWVSSFSGININHYCREFG
uniref:Uncharacterized protein n=1 Tax=Anguilla anguilla TaxID=7936 RepID=A0A0E9XUF4_ANGAN